MTPLRDHLPPPPWEGPPVPGFIGKTRGETRNPRGGLTLAPFMVKSMDRSNEVSLMGLVDTGAIYSALPPAVIAALELPYIGTLPITLSDGRSVPASLHAGIIEIEGREIATTFATLGDGLITVGVRDLEGLGFKVNPTTGKLEATPIYG